LMVLTCQLLPQKKIKTKVWFTEQCLVNLCCK
jgi:hypothetical protein